MSSEMIQEAYEGLHKTKRSGLSSYCFYIKFNELCLVIGNRLRNHIPALD